MPRAVCSSEQEGLDKAFAAIAGHLLLSLPGVYTQPVTGALRLPQTPTRLPVPPSHWPEFPQTCPQEQIPLLQMAVLTYMETALSSPYLLAHVLPSLS